MASKRITQVLTRANICNKKALPSNDSSITASTFSLSRRTQARCASSSRLHRNQADEERSEEARAMERSFTRDWKVGDVYAPHDLSAAEARKWRQKKAPTQDAFDILSINPLDVYKNFSIMSEFVTDMGRIKPRSLTGLRLVNQRRLAKAIRRAIALGFMPSAYKHPELLKWQRDQNANDYR